MVISTLFGKKKQSKEKEGDPTLDSEALDSAKGKPEDENQPQTGSSALSSGQSPQSEPPAAVHLEQAMLENVRNNTPETRTKVYQELLFSDLLLALADPSPDAENKETGSKNINVAILANPQGVQFAAAFTSATAARRWRAQGGHYVSVRGQDIFKLLEPSPAQVITINPGSAPFVVLDKNQYRQLALGVAPQTQESPVQVALAPPSSEGQPQEENAGMQISFPPDAFSNEQRQHILNILMAHENIKSVALGAVLPPQAPKGTTWLRTVFLDVQMIEINQETMQKFCQQIRVLIGENAPCFTDVSFEVGVMPDPQFWAAVRQNQVILFDKSNESAQPQDVL